MFVALRGGSVRALDPERGQIVWEAAAVGGRLAASEAALVARGADGTLVRLELDSGVVRWRTPTSVTGTLPPALGGDRVFVAGKGAAALDLVSGRVLWTSDEGEASAAPVLSGHTLLVGEQDGTLRARDAFDGHTQWTFATGAPILAAPVVDERGRVFIGTTSRRLLAVSLAAGKPLWRWRVGADVQAPPAVLGGSVVFGTHESVLYALNRRNGNLVWRQTLPSRPRSGPLVVGSAVIVACFETDLVGFDGRTGKRLGGLKVASTFATAPLLVGTRLFVGLRDRGTLAAVDLATAAPEEGASPSPPPGPGATPSPSVSPGPSPTPTPGPLS